MEPVLERIKPMTMTESAALFIESFSLSGTPEGIAAEMTPSWMSTTAGRSP